MARIQELEADNRTFHDLAVDRAEKLEATAAQLAESNKALEDATVAAALNSTHIPLEKAAEKVIQLNLQLATARKLVEDAPKEWGDEWPYEVQREWNARANQFLKETAR